MLKAADAGGLSCPPREIGHPIGSWRASSTHQTGGGPLPALAASGDTCGVSRFGPRDGLSARATLGAFRLSAEFTVILQAILSFYINELSLFPRDLFRRSVVNGRQSAVPRRL